MTTYSKFASSLSASHSELANGLIQSLRAKYNGHDPLQCASERPGDAEHFKILPVQDLPPDDDDCEA